MRRGDNGTVGRQGMDACIPQAAFHENVNGSRHLRTRLGSADRGNRYRLEPGAFPSVDPIALYLLLHRMDRIELLADTAGKICLGALDFRRDRIADDEVAEPLLGLGDTAAEQSPDERQIDAARTVI